MILVVLCAAVIGLAFANGANDNFKGVATLCGSGTANYRQALGWATATTLLGSIAAFFMAETLIQRFTGKGLVADATVARPEFAVAVGLGAALTVLVATRVGVPVSTTHSLVGGLFGAGLVSGSALDWRALGSNYLLPLMVSPIVAIVATAVAYPILHCIRSGLGITRDICLCAGSETLEVIPASNLALAAQRAQQLTATVGDRVTCESRYHGEVWGISVGRVLDRLHFLSAGLVSFARGLNDTPKITAVLLVAPFADSGTSLVLVGAAIALGGLLSARRVAETMSYRITSMNHGQALTANLTTGLIVIGASQLGMPVSTTHVSCGTLFGIGGATRQGHKRTIVAVVFAWLVTLPVAAAISAAAYALMQAR